MEFPENIREEDRPIPWYFKIFYLIVFLWCVWYLIHSLKIHGIDAVTPIEKQVSIK